jgi:hypothetical protein
MNNVNNKIDFDYVEYKGKKYPFRISHYAIKRTKKEFDLSNVDLTNLENTMDMDVLEKLLFYAIEFGCAAQNIEMDFEYDGNVMALIVDLNYEKVLSAYALAFVAVTKVVQDQVEEAANSVETKKKEFQN